FFASGDGAGHIQSLVIGGALLTVGVLVSTLGILADLIATNRKLLEANMLKLRRIEERLDQGDARPQAGLFDEVETIDASTMRQKRAS
ncbi:MAG: glycosyltransferase family 2 protein, partial [Pseudomonadota bacterium]